MKGLRAPKHIPSAVLIALGLLLASDGYHTMRAAISDSWTVHRSDFNPYYWAAKRIQRGNVSELYELWAIDDDGERIFTKDFKNIPIVAVLFTPYSRLSYPDAWRRFWLTSCFFAVVGWLMATLWARRWCSWWLFASAVMFWAAANYYPVHRSFRLGQTSLLVAVLLFAAYLALSAGREKLGGALLGICALIKIPATLFAVLLAATGRWRAFTTLCAVGLSAWIASIALFGVDIHRTWYREVIAANTGTVFTALNNQSLVSQVARLADDELPIVGRRSYVPRSAPIWISAIRWISVVLVLWLWTRARRNVAPESVRLPLDLAFTVGFMPLLYPVFWIHYYVLSLVVALPLWRLVLVERAGRPAIGVLLAAVYLLPAMAPSRHPDRWFLDKYADLWVELGLGRFLYGSLVLILTCFVIARQFAGRESLRQPMRSASMGHRVDSELP